MRKGRDIPGKILFRRGRRGSGFLEWMFIVSMVIAALVVMSTYLRNAMMGGWKKAGDALANGRVFGDIQCHYDDRIQGMVDSIRYDDECLTPCTAYNDPVLGGNVTPSYADCTSCLEGIACPVQ